MNRNPSSNRAKTLISLGICGLAIIGAAILGVDDNPPGLTLAYVAAACFVFAFVHSWRSVRKFGLLALASLVGFLIFALIHNIFEGFVFPITTGLVKSVVEGISVAAFLLAVLISPAGFAVGLMGMVGLLIRKQFQRKRT